MGAAQPIKGALEQGKQPLSLSCLQAGASRPAARIPSAPSGIPIRHLHSEGSSANHWVSTLTMRVTILTVW